MGEVKRIGSLEIDQDIDTQRHEWKVSQFTWAVFLLILLAGLCGLLGPGPLSDRSAGQDAQGLRVEYARFAHYHAPERLHVQVAAGDERELRLWLDRAYAEAIEIERIQPEPERVVARPDRLVYVFQRATADEASDIEFTFEFCSIGPHTCRIGTEGGASLSFDQFVYP